MGCGEVKTAGHSRIADFAGTRWKPERDMGFDRQRLRPALDLAARIPLESPDHVVDLGCGTGNVTRLLAEHWPNADVYGVDSSSEMLAQARARDSRIHWQQADIASWSADGRPDLIYSNAVLHWLPDHAVLFPHLISQLRHGGFLAIQMPLSWDLPSHRLMRETLSNGGPGGTSIGSHELRDGMRQSWVATGAEYHDLLNGYLADLDIWETEYLQILEGEDPVFRWVESTGLRPILNALDDADRTVFVSAYRKRLRDAYPRRPDGSTLYPFRRLFIIGQTPESS